MILEALADVGSLSSWSPVHKRDPGLDWYADGRPHHVKATIKIFGLVDNEILEYHWGPNWVVWDAGDTFQQRGQHVEYNLQPLGIDKTRVRFDIAVEPAGPVPAFAASRRARSCWMPRPRDSGPGDGSVDGEPPNRVEQNAGPRSRDGTVVLCGCG